MSSILIEKKYALEYIRDILNSYKDGKITVENAKYHHNSSFEDAASICKYGILSMLDMKKLGIKNYTDELLELMDDIDSHINGINAVSLSVVGLTDLYIDEDEYNPFSVSKVDFLVSSDIQAGRSTQHYGNEFLSRSSIPIDMLRSIDIRLLQLVQLLEQEKKLETYPDSLRKLVEKYNCLKGIALAMKSSGLMIPLREMSDSQNYSMDIERMATASKLILK